MSKKKIVIPPKKSLQLVEEKIDSWISGSDVDLNPKNNLTPQEEKIEMESRFTIVIPTYLHRRIKKACAASGISMKDKIFDVLKQEFPET